jgi:hypothetical protein
MDPLQIRENEVFETLKKIRELKFVVIGGYAVNAYTLPRFSVDCDIVVEDKIDTIGIHDALLKIGYIEKEQAKIGYLASFGRYEKDLGNSFKVSFDVLVKEVLDRQTGVSISAEWVFKNSDVRTLKGKTITDKLNVRIINLDALVIMKMISCRPTDIRDIFMLAPNINDRTFIKKEIASKYNFEERFKKVKEKVTSDKFRDGLQGIYGLIDSKIFEKSVDSILALNDET